MDPITIKHKLHIACAHLSISLAELSRRMWPNENITEKDIRPQRLAGMLRTPLDLNEMERISAALECGIEVSVRPGEDTELAIILPSGQRI